MKNVRMIYKKGGPLRFVSHLDMNRFMTRLIRLSGVPIWYTEGFNKHPYITFALPLSLGFCSDYEVMDFRIEEDDFSLEKAKEMIASVSPEGIEITSVSEPVYKAGKIAFADFEVKFSDDSGADALSLNEFLGREEIICSKKTKKGGISEINVAQKIAKYEVLDSDGTVALKLRLPAGGQDNINPKIIINAYFDEIVSPNPYCNIKRTKLYLEDGSIFK